MISLALGARVDGKWRARKIGSGLPVLVVPPTLAGPGVIGTPVTVDPGQWQAAPVPTFQYQWRRDGAAIAGATGPDYVPVDADDRATLTCVVTASTAFGSVTAESAGLAIVRAAPVASGLLDDLSLVQGAGPATVAAAADFTGGDLTFAVSGPSATIDSASGAVTIATDLPLEDELITVTASNSGGSATTDFRVSVGAGAPALVSAPSLSGAGVDAGTGSATIGVPVTLDPGLWSGTPAPVLALQWLRDGVPVPGATGASYTPGPGDDLALLSGRVTATNSGGGLTVETAALTVRQAPPVVTGTLLDEIHDQFTGPQEVDAWTVFDGAGLTYSVTGAGASVDPATGVVTIPTDVALSETVTVTATNSGGSATAAFPFTVEADPLEVLGPGDVEIVRAVFRPADQTTWFSPIVRFPGLAGETVHEIEWTTSGQDPIPEQHFEILQETSTPGEYALFMRDPARNAPLASPRVDFSVWRSNEGPRLSALRFRWRRTPDAAWSPLSVNFTVPVAVPADGPWSPVITRNAQQFAVNEIGGNGYQFHRSLATSPAMPSRVMGAMDVGLPIKTDDFGGWWETPGCRGLYGGYGGNSVAIDSGDGDRILVTYSANDQRSKANIDAWAGIYLSEDGGETWTLRQNLPLLIASSDFRWNMQLIAEAPGGTPATRTWYVIHQGAEKDGPMLPARLWRSTDGGATWAEQGSPLDTVTYGDRIYQLAVAPEGALYMSSNNGIWRSDDAGLSWIKCGLPEGHVRALDVRGGNGEVWVSRDGDGLYLSTDAGVSFARNEALVQADGGGSYDIRSFAISPVLDPVTGQRRICVLGNKQVTPYYSHDGGASWAEIDTRKMLGQTNGFAHLIQFEAGQYLWHATDPDLVIAHRFQHMGLSRDGGRTFEWASTNFDWNSTHDIGFHPTDWRKIALGMQDRACVYTENGGDYWYDDGVVSADKDRILAAVNSNKISGSGAIVHESGRVVVGMGSGFNRVPVILDPAADGTPIQQITVKDTIGTAFCTIGSLHPQDGDVAYLGRWRIEALDASNPGDVVFADMSFDDAGGSDVNLQFVGTSKADGDVVYGVRKSSNNGGKEIYRSTDRGQSWTLWTETNLSFRPINSKPVMAVCPHSTTRVYAPRNNGRLVRIEGLTSPSETVIFNARDYTPDDHPNYEINWVAVDPVDADLLYVSLAMFGCPVVFRSRDGGATWEDITRNLPLQDGKLFVHPLTRDVIFTSNHGQFVLSPPAPVGIAAGAASIGTESSSLYARSWSFVETNR